MIGQTAAALFHNTATCVTLGNTPLHAVPVAVARQLRPLLESSTSLVALTIHTQFTPPGSLRLVLLGASRCRSLQRVRLVGGVSVLQAKMMMAAFTHFTFARRLSRPASNSPRRTPRTPTAAQNGRYARPHSSAPAPFGATKSPPPHLQWLNGVHFVLDLHHLDDIAAGFLLRGLEQSERIVGFGVNVMPASHAATRAAARMLLLSKTIVARNESRVNDLISQSAQGHLHCMAKVEVPLCSPRLLQSKDVLSVAGSDDGVYRGDSASREKNRISAMMEREASLLALRKFSSRRYTPPRLQSELPQGRPSQPRMWNTRLNLFFDDERNTKRMTKGENNDANHSNECFVCGCGVSNTFEMATKSVLPTINRNDYTKQTPDGSSPGPTPHNAMMCTQPSASLSPNTPGSSPACAPPLSRGRYMQHIRHLRGCVKDLNAVVVRYQVVSRDSVERLVAELRTLEGQLTENVTTMLTDMMMFLSDLDNPGF